MLFSVSFELTDITDVQQMSADDVLPGFTHLLQSHLLLGHAHPKYVMFLVRMLSMVKVKKIKNKHGTGINTSVSELSLQGWRWKKKRRQSATWFC